MNEKIAFLCEDLKSLNQAQKVADDLHLPLVTDKRTDYEFFLEVAQGRLQLVLNSSPAPGPVYVDFEKGSLDYRRRYGGKGGQTILKAIGGSDKRVLDGTAGLARDAFILASLGCKVVALEKSSVVAALVIDGLRRARENPKLIDICNRLNYKVGETLETPEHPFDVIYLDPMFPEKKKSALPKKEMQVLQALLALPDSSEDLKMLERAKALCKRVVVKRPSHGEPLGSQPQIQFESGSVRFDVYLN